MGVGGREMKGNGKDCFKNKWETKDMKKLYEPYISVIKDTHVGLTPPLQEKPLT